MMAYLREPFHDEPKKEFQALTGSTWVVYNRWKILFLLAFQIGKNKEVDV